MCPQVNQGIGRTPHEATFGCLPHLGLKDTRLPPSIRRVLETEEQLGVDTADDDLDAPAAAQHPVSPDDGPAGAGPSRRHCIICDGALAGDEHCCACGGAVHTQPPCSEDCPDGPRCSLCQREEAATQQRHQARGCQQHQAQRMLRRAGDAAKELEVGTNVRVGIPDVDRARNQQRNLIGVVMEVSMFYAVRCLN